MFVFTKDPKDVDVVHKAIGALCKVYVDIIPSYRIREDQSMDKVDDKTGKEKGMKLSKEVKQLRDYEKFLLDSYKEYLEMLERLSSLNPQSLVNKKTEDQVLKDELIQVYTRLRQLSVHCFCDLIKKHPHFNFRINILETIMPKLAFSDKTIRKEVTETLFQILRNTDQTLLDFKVDTLRELSKVIKTKPHENMENNLLDCLVLHLIIVDEQKAQAIHEST